MVKRRGLLIGLGSVAAGGFAVSTGAFTNTEMDRTVDVTVADEADAYLGLESSEGPNSAFANVGSAPAGEQIELDFNSLGSISDGDGLGENSEYTFDNVFHVNNQGTQEVEVTITTIEEFNDEDIMAEFYADGDDESPIDDDGVEIGTGHTAEIGVRIETGEDLIPDGSDNFDAQEDATIHAEATE